MSIGLGTRLWLRWHEGDGNWLPTETEVERSRANRLAERLRSLGIDPEDEV